MSCDTIIYKTLDNLVSAFFHINVCGVKRHRHTGGFSGVICRQN
jgi:hypothetical protein